MSHPLAHRRYLKMNGLGNEILVVDLRDLAAGAAGGLAGADVRAVASEPATRFDQLMAVGPARSAGADASVAIYNADGSPAGACGNGTRCVAWALMSDPAMGNVPGPRLVLDGPGGRLAAERVSPFVFTVDMGRPGLRWDEIPLAEPFADTRRIELQIGPADAPILHSPGVVSMGNPHAVFWVDDVDAYDLGRIGPMLENHPIFPERANISLAHAAAPDRVRLRVWERGAGLTQACGSAACAALVSGARLRLTGRDATVSLPGGDLRIAWRETDDRVLMTGPVELEGEGTFRPDLFVPETADRSGRAA